MIYRRFNIVFGLIAFVGVLTSLKMIYDGSRPCSGEGCLIFMEVLMGLPLLVLCGFILYRCIKKERKYLRDNNSAK